MQVDTAEVGFLKRSRPGSVEELTVRAHEDKDPATLQAKAAVERASPQDLDVEHYPMGVLIIQLRLNKENVSIVDVVCSEYMRWAIVASLEETLNRITLAGVHAADVLPCTEQVEILEVNTPTLGASVWQFCDIRFDYRLRVSNLSLAGKLVHDVFINMKEVEARFCKSLEMKFNQFYNLTVYRLKNKQAILTDGLKKSKEARLFQVAQAGDLASLDALLLEGVEIDAVQKPWYYPIGLLEEELHWLYVTMGRTPLLGAAEEGHLGCLRALLENKANVNVQDRAGFHPLYLAAGVEDNCEEMLQLLLQEGAILDMPNKAGYTALHNACGSGNAKAIAWLIQAKADVSLKSETGATAVHVAVLNQEPTALRALMEQGVNLDMPAFGGNTAVHEAVLLNSADIINLLFELRADMNIETGPEYGYATPLGLAIARKRKAAEAALTALGAKTAIMHELEDGSFGAWKPGDEGPRVRGRAAYKGRESQLSRANVLLSHSF